MKLTLLALATANTVLPDAVCCSPATRSYQAELRLRLMTSAQSSSRILYVWQQMRA